MKVFFFLLWLSAVIVIVAFALQFHPGEFALTVGGTILGFLLSQASLGLARADLRLAPVVDSANTIGTDGVDRWKFLHIEVANSPSGIKEKLFGSRTAVFCQANVEFSDASGSRRLFSLDGRWSSTGEPTQLISSGRIFDFSKVPALRFDHISPGKSAHLVVAVKNDHQSQFYGFSNISYAFPKLDNPDWKVSSNSSRVRVTIVAGNGESVTKEFVISNPNGGLADFSLAVG